MSNETATKRIPVTPTTFDTIRDFCRGLNMSYSDCLEFMYQQLANANEAPIEAGLRMRNSTTNKPE